MLTILALFSFFDGAGDGSVAAVTQQNAGGKPDGERKRKPIVINLADGENANVVAERIKERLRAQQPDIEPPPKPKGRRTRLQKQADAAATAALVGMEIERKQQELVRRNNDILAIILMATT